MQFQRLTPWIIGTALACAAFGAWFGHHLGDGRTGNVVLISLTCAVLGSFVPNAVTWIRSRLTGQGPRQGAA